MKNRGYEDDDGRTIADMSDVSRQPLILPRLPKKQKPAENEPETDLSKNERRAYVRGALGAGLAIGGVFVAAGAAVIALLLAVWK
ncbi:MAG: hypothetical protein K6G90_02170 [Clostridia bacterium]|nr:hypothetical protein [Clostridia bacterium]